MEKKENIITRTNENVIHISNTVMLDLRKRAIIISQSYILMKTFL